MDSIWSIIITSVLGLSVVGDIVMRIFFRTERRKAEADAQGKENQMWHDRLQEQREANRELNLLVGAMSEQLKTANGECSDKTKQIRKLNALLLDEQQKNLNYERIIASKDRFIVWLKIWHCRREKNGRKSGCDRRLPQQEVPIPYTPPPEMEEKDEISEPKVESEPKPESEPEEEDESQYSDSKMAVAASLSEAPITSA